MKALAVAAALAVFAFGLTGCGGKRKAVSGNQPPSRTVVQTGPASGKPLKTFTVRETDFRLTPSMFTASKSGTYTFHAVNKGHVEHSLEIEGRGVEKELGGKLKPGQSGDLTVVLSPGTYEIYCPVDDHESKGMKGTIKVPGAKGTAPPATTSSSGSGGYQ
jgi:uncharacterized cupredoxin-like copper-binding protein